MSTRILLLAVGLAAFSSCSSVYKSGQTPDDVYYSPARPQEEYVEVQKDEDRYQTYEEYQDNYRNDRFLRLGIGNPYYMSYYNDYYAFSDWRYNAYSLNFNSPWNNYWTWNSFYNPYCYYPGVTYINTHNFNYGGYSRPAGKPVAFDIRSYSRPNNGTRNGNFNNSYYNNTNNNSRYNNSNSFGNTLQRVFSGSANNHNNNNSSTPSNNTSTPTRSYTPSSSGSSGGSSSGGSTGGGVSRPGRGGR